MVSRALPAAVGLVADRAFGEPPVSPHPVAAFGQLMRAVERRAFADRRSCGLVHATAGVATGAVAGAAIGSTAVATYLAVAGRALGESAARVERALQAGDLEGARRLLPALVGRDPTGLDEKEVARAVVESVAENTVDAVVAPALWGALAGAPGALGYRAVNTLDSMVGHRSPRYLRYGWASARLDDLAGWVPARATATLVAAVRPGAAAEVWRAVRRDAPGHPSPNAGVAESAFAAALGLRLGGPNRYGSPPRDRAAPHPRQRTPARAQRHRARHRAVPGRQPAPGCHPGPVGPGRAAAVIPVGRHGGDGARLAAALGVAPGQVLDLSASLNPVAPDPAPILAAHLDAIGRYPDSEAATDALAAAIGVTADRVLLTNGGSEAIALVAAELGAGWVDEPDFSLYRRHLPALDRHGARWRSNPHNPSGLLAPPAASAGVWDEAFWPLATGTWTRGDADHGAVVLGSLTKLLACPGLRVGYILARPDLIVRLARRQPRWAVNGLVCAALADLLATVDLAIWCKETARLREQLVAILGDHGLATRPSEANWVLVDAPALRHDLARRAILVRDCASFGLPGTVRVAVPDVPGLDRLEEALPPWPA